MKKLFLLFLFYTISIMPGITGKISGKVTDAATGESLIGINVVVQGTKLGAATDVNGNYVINNVEPGVYTLIATGIGYSKTTVTSVKVSADFTTNLDIKLNSEAMNVTEIVIQAESPLVRKDLTSTHTVVDVATIESLPVESIDQILSLQAGIIRGVGGELHIRGGRSTEVDYTINGVSVSNPFDNTRTVTISTNAIQELSVVQGTFNAEYGNALSGVVNTITKEGSQEYKGYLSFYTGDFLSTRDNVFFNIDDLDPINNFVWEGTFGGPIPFAEELISFFASVRYNKDKGYLYGIRQHLPTDSVYKSLDLKTIRIASSGDNSIVPMNVGEDLNSTLKLTFKPWAAFKINYDAVFSKSKFTSYNHEYKYNPNGIPNRYELGLLNSLEIRHALSNNTFYSLKGSFNIYDYKRYLYPLLYSNGKEVDYNPEKDYRNYMADPRYQPSYKLTKLGSSTFLSGGTSNDHYYQRAYTTEVKFDLTSQINTNHEAKFGLQAKWHNMKFEEFTILRDSTRYLTPTIEDISTSTHDRYSKTPVQYSAYIQDKMEYSSLIINAGLRFDYFNSLSLYSANIDEPTAGLEDAEAKFRISPRIGISFPITDQGIIHFSYGHFYQIPPFNYLYSNPNFETNVGIPTFGNANLNPEKTVTYEMGLQQQLTENLAFNVTGFYKDVRDLLALQQVRVSTSATYYKYVNKDYGNIKGITFSLVKRKNAADFLGASLDYTFQVAEGNETDANSFFLDLSSGRQTEKVPVPLGWDQQHTLNATITVGNSRDWNVTLVGRIGSGLPYTPQLDEQQIFLRANSGRRPSQTSVDLLAEKSFEVYGTALTIFLKVFNLFDQLNERTVYDDTGRSTYTLEELKGNAQEMNDLASRIPGAHSATEYYNRPHYYSAPREVRVGMSFEF